MNECSYFIGVKGWWFNTLFCCRRLKFAQTKTLIGKQELTFTWNKRFPIRISYVIPTDITATHTCACRFIMAYHGDYIRCKNAMFQTFALCNFIRNFVTRRFRKQICFHTVKSFDPSCLNGNNVCNQKYRDTHRW